MAHRLVPPPPAYMPSILPEHYYHGSSYYEEEEEVELVSPDGSVKTVSAKPENRFAKYIYAPNGNIPKVVPSRSGVTNWSQVKTQ